MNGRELQDKCRELVQVAESKDEDVTIAALALAGEAGEVANDVKKFLYGRFGRNELRCRTIRELKDNLYYISCVANALDIDLDEVMDGVVPHIAEKIMGAMIQNDPRVAAIAQVCAA